MVSRGGFKLENQNEVGCNSFFEEPAHLGYSWDQQFACGEGFNFNFGLPPLLDYIEPFSMSSHHHHHHPTMALTNYIEPRVELNDFEEIADDLGLWDFDQPPPLIHNNVQDQNPNPATTMITQDDGANNHAIIDPRHHHHQQQDEVEVLDHELQSNLNIISNNYDMNIMDVRRNGTRYKSSSLKLEEIQKYFHLPITKAAKELNVGLTVLKKRCRELNIARWPHRKIKSLKCLIHNVRELGLTSEIEMLEEHKRMVETIPEMELTERTKKLRQACFKANYKKRRSLLHQAAALS